MRKFTKIAGPLTPSWLPALKMLTRKLTPALLLAATLPLSSSAQTLPVTAGLQLWLKADAGITTNSTGLVTKWADQSGKGNDAVQSPTNGVAAPKVDEAVNFVVPRGGARRAQENGGQDQYPGGKEFLHNINRGCGPVRPHARMSKVPKLRRL